MIARIGEWQRPVSKQKSLHRVMQALSGLEVG